jgi:hypothetical protein
MTDYLRLKGFNSIFETTLNNELQDNLVEFLDWALLEKGNYFNVHLGELSPNNQDYSLLRLSSNEQYVLGQAWEGFRKNWVWQSGVNYTPAPIVSDDNARPGISGVYVNDIFYPSNTVGQYSHVVDYFNGRIIFNDPIPTGSKVQAEYSYKYINIIYANNLPWLREIQYRTYEPSQSFININEGEFAVPPEMRVQLPAIALEVVPRRTLRGYQLGGGQFIDTDILFHCMAEDAVTRNKLIDIISLQSDKTLIMFNSNTIAENHDFPLDYRGVPVSGALIYPLLLEKYGFNRIRLKNAVVQGIDLINSNFHAGIVRITTEIISTHI